MFQTNCCVHGGVSGGPIVRRANFKMLGIVVCNVVLSNDSVLYPRLCMAIPTTVFKKPLDDYLRTAGTIHTDSLKSFLFFDFYINSKKNEMLLRNFQILKR